jgi:HAD superfamily hydrolase (TIGR01484 family)
MTIRVLTTDLDGTLIPLEGNEAHRQDLVSLSALLRLHQLPLIFVTGRHAMSVQQALATHRLPQPDGIVCDVGTTILRKHVDGQFRPQDEYAQHLAELVGDWDIERIRSQLSQLLDIRLQEEEKQGCYKCSFYTQATQLEQDLIRIRDRLHERNAPWSVIGSIDPFNNDGLIDVLPLGVSKSFAINWWAEFEDCAADEIIFAGDSGNDLAPLTAGYLAIVVANAADTVRNAARNAHQNAGWTERLYLAEHTATSGVLEGLRHFLTMRGAS